MKTSRLKLGDVENSLEMLVENIEKSITETPEEEERDDEGEREDERFAPEKSACQRRSRERDAATSHFE